jgi:membrane protein
VRSFFRHRTRRLAAGLAYYSLFALVPTLFLALTIVATIFGQEADTDELSERLDDIVGTEAAEQVETEVQDLFESFGSSSVTLITIGVVLYSASVLFVAWRDSLGDTWGLRYRTGVEPTIRRRVFGVLVPIAVGFLLATITLLQMLAALVGDFVTSPLFDALLNITSLVSPLIVTIVALSLLYRYSTRIRPVWRDIWPAAMVTAVLLAVLTWGYGLYVRVFGGSSAAGAAGAVVLGLVFVNLAAQVLLFGAELISATAERAKRRLADGQDDD